jgi:hypothetical protein
MTQAVVACSLVVAGFNLLAGIVGAVVWYTGAEASSGTSRAFWVLLRVGQGAALALVIVVGSLAAAGNYATDDLFYLYALLPLPVAFIAEQLRVVSAQHVLDQRGLADASAVGALPQAEQHALVAAILRREVGVMATSAVVVAFLAARAAGTAHGF